VRLGRYVINDPRMECVQIFDMVDEKSREKCLKEIKLVKALHHPNIIQYYDAFIEDNELLLVFEYAEVSTSVAENSVCACESRWLCQAGDLKRQLRKALEREARFDERVIWKYFSQIADGRPILAGGN
jgi:serine/threonine protein kinase